ncbi:HAD family hydrolase [Microcoleus sp. ARI1-B5]|uniref:HAD family hydrolase n=1 Tax=unclassified Microcoleus TaxID=2642155 RepID=UPI002FCE7F32
MIKIIVFDVDDTLFPEREFVQSGFQAVGEWMLNKYAISGFFEIAWKFFAEGKRGQIFNWALAAIGVEDEPEIIQEMLQIYRNHEPQISLHEDARWAIAYFRGHKKLGAITDGYLKTQRNKVEALAIADSFDTIVYSDLYGRENWKPSPVPYLKVMELTGCSGSECVYIGDNPHKDFVTAKKLNWMTVQICRPDGEYSHITPALGYAADRKIFSLTDLESILPLNSIERSDHR